MKHLLRKYEAGLTPYEARAIARMKRSVPYRAAAHFISVSVFMAEGCFMFPKGTLHSTKQKRLAEASLFVWQEWRDLNPRMTESKSVALPLGYTPIQTYI